MQVLNLGMGKWDGSVVRSSNPQRRDVQLMFPAASATVPSFLVIQWTANNPGGKSNISCQAEYNPLTRYSMAAPLPLRVAQLHGSRREHRRGSKLNNVVIDGCSERNISHLQFLECVDEEQQVVDRY